METQISKSLVTQTTKNTELNSTAIKGFHGPPLLTKKNLILIETKTLSKLILKKIVEPQFCAMRFNITHLHRFII